MWVKICGTTNLADARLAIDLGADALGFIFAPSRRQVTPEQVAAITPLLPDHVERIGVFTSGEPEAIAAAALHAGLTGVQLHAEFSPDFFTRFETAAAGRLSTIRTLHWTVSLPGSAGQSMRPEARNATSRARDEADAGSSQTQPLAQALRDLAVTSPEQRVLLDSRVDGRLGGTGVSFPWAPAAASLADARGALRLIVAGGLRPDNVAAAIHALLPYGVDVVSGVEQEPGKKDPKQLHDFIEQARSARAQHS